MDDSLARLLWALPLVLLLGVASIWLLKRWLVQIGRVPGASTPLVLEQSMALSERATAHLLEIGGRRVLVVESGDAINSIELATPGRRAGGWQARLRNLP